MVKTITKTITKTSRKTRRWRDADGKKHRKTITKRSIRRITNKRRITKNKDAETPMAETPTPVNKCLDAKCPYYHPATETPDQCHAVAPIIDNPNDHFRTCRRWNDPNPTA